jgi:hypothetical protein
MTPSDIDAAEATVHKSLAAWTDNGRQPDGLDGNDAWEWAANHGVDACELALQLIAEIRRLKAAQR